jgi:hypothetical protein
MLSMEQIERAIRNFEFMLKNKVYPNPREIVELCLENTKELRAWKTRAEALDQISGARKAGKEPSEETWRKFHQAKTFLETSNDEYKKGCTLEDRFQVSEEVLRNNERLENVKS